MDDRAEQWINATKEMSGWDVGRAVQDLLNDGYRDELLLVVQAATARQRERDAQIADSFCGVLTPEQWPPHGLAAERNRCGDSAETARRLAEAIRRQP